MACCCSFGHPQYETAVLAEVVATRAGRAAEKLRRQGLAVYLATVLLGTHRYAPAAGPSTLIKVVALAAASQDEGVLTRATAVGLHRLCRPGVAHACVRARYVQRPGTGRAGQLGLFASPAAHQQRRQ